MRGESHDEGEEEEELNVCMMLNRYDMSAEVCLFGSDLGGTPELCFEVANNYKNHDITAETVRLYILDIF